MARLEVLNNGSAVPDDLSASSEQGRNGGKLPPEQHLSFETFVPRRQLPEGNASFYQVAPGTPGIKRVRHGIERMQF